MTVVDLVMRPLVRRLPGLSEYAGVWAAMKQFTEQRDAATPDEFWLCEHEPVYTLGQAGKLEHLLNTAGVAVVRTDRGGQVTYHGPGQVVLYPLVDLRRAGLFVKDYVSLLEDTALDALAAWGIGDACRKPGAPGIYVPDPAGTRELAKIAALGIKIRNGRAYHGLSLNVAMDLTPFDGINPCGYAGLRTVDMASCGVVTTPAQVGEHMADYLCARLAARIHETRTGTPSAPAVQLELPRGVK